MSTKIEITVSWDEGLLSHIEIPQLLLRPIKKEDAAPYKKI